MFSWEKPWIVNTLKNKIVVSFPAINWKRRPEVWDSFFKKTKKNYNTYSFSCSLKIYCTVPWVTETVQSKSEDKRETYWTSISGIHCILEQDGWIMLENYKLLKNLLLMLITVLNLPELVATKAHRIHNILTWHGSYGSSIFFSYFLILWK